MSSLNVLCIETPLELVPHLATVVNCSLWIVAQVQATGHQLYQVRDHAVTYWVSRWEPPAMGGDPPSLPPSGDSEIFVRVPIARAGKLQNKYISFVFIF